MSRQAGVKRKAQITRVAQNKFREKGFRAVSMRELADHVGIKAASFYNHFPSKHHILRDICFTIAEEFFVEFDESLKNAKSPEDRLKSAIHAHVKVITSNADASAVFFHDWRHLNDPHLTKFKKMRRNYEGGFRKIIREGMLNGSFNQEDEGFTILMIFSSLNWIYEWYDVKGKYTPKQIADKLSSIILSGIKKSH